MKYTEYRYLWPPRPDRKIPPTNLDQLERMRWWGQAKFNGTLCTMYVTPDGDTLAMGRHGPDHKLAWQPGPAWQAFVNTLAPGWHVFVGELLNDKVKGGPRGVIVLFDMLVEDGEYLVGTTLRERFHRLTEMLNLYNRDARLELTHREYNEGVWLVENRARAFTEWFAALDRAPDMIEGLVFKSPDGRLQPCGRSASNSAWQVKCRRPTANKSF